MTRRLGRIEASIATAFITKPDHSYTAAELCKVAFPSTKQIEKRHRVAVLRAADKIADIIGWTKAVSGTPREARYARPVEARAAKPSAEEALPAAAQSPQPDRAAECVANHIVEFLKSILDPGSIRAFVGELERTDVRLLRERV